MSEVELEFAELASLPRVAGRAEARLHRVLQRAARVGWVCGGCALGAGGCASESHCCGFFVWIFFVGGRCCGELFSDVWIFSGEVLISFVRANYPRLGIEYSGKLPEKVCCGDLSSR